MAFTELVQRHLPLVYSAAVRRLDGDTHQAADVAQLVFVSMARESKSLLRHTCVTAWLYTATRNVAISLQRSERRRRLREISVSILNDSEPQPDWEQLRPLLDEAMDELSEQDREAILLHFFQGRRYAEISATLGMGPDAVRKRVERALEKLRSVLESSGMKSATAALGVLLSGNAAVPVPPALAGEIISVAAAANAGLATGALTTLAITAIGPGKIAAILAAAAVVLVGGSVVTYHLYSHTSARERVSTERAESASAQGRARLSNDAATTTPKATKGSGQPADEKTLQRLSGFVQIAQERLTNKLTVDEAQILDRLYNNLLAERRKLELGLAKSEVVNDSSVLITIPEYYSKGREHYAAFGREIVAELGERGTEIIETLDTTIRADNRQFGAAAQSILVEDRGESVHIVHGSGGLIQVDVDGHVGGFKMTTISELMKTNLVSYDYLKALFPQPQSTLIRRN